MGLNLPPLSKRDAWSATFEHVLNVLDTPRTDCPVHLPEPPPLTLPVEVEAEQPLNDLQKHILEVISYLNQIPYPHHINQQKHVSQWANVHFHSHAKRTHHWKTSKDFAPQAYEVAVQSDGKNWVEAHWNVNHESAIDYMTISTRTLTSTVELTTTDPHNHSPITFPLVVPYCLDNGKYQSGAVVTISACYPSATPSSNRDVSQHWIWGKDATVRPFANQTLCLTNTLYENGSSKLTVEDCKDTVAQNYGWDGPAPGGGNSGQIEFGPGIVGIITVAK